MPAIDVLLPEHLLQQNKVCNHTPGKAVPILLLEFVPTQLGWQFYNHSGAGSEGQHRHAPGLKIYLNASLRQSLPFQPRHHPLHMQPEDQDYQTQHRKHVPMNNPVHHLH